VGKPTRVTLLPTVIVITTTAAVMTVIGTETAATATATAVVAGITDARLPLAMKATTARAGPVASAVNVTLALAVTEIAAMRTAAQIAVTRIDALIAVTHHNRVVTLVHQSLGVSQCLTPTLSCIQLQPP
jgi:hypothetical protein